MVWLFLYIVLVKIIHILGCSCVNHHNQKHFCSSDLAIRALVLKEKEVFNLKGYGHASDIIYDVKVGEIFKNKFNDEFKIEAGETVKVVTPGTDGDCKAEIKNGTDYLFVGSLKQGAMFVTSCDWSMRFDYLTEHHVEGLMGKYDCSCKVLTLSYALRDFPRDFRSVCLLGYPQQYSDTCVRKHGFCQRHTGSGQCVWTVDRDHEDTDC